MSEAYDQYLNEHISSVKNGWQWMKDHLIENLDIGEPINIWEIDKRVGSHDESKTKPDEYYAYDRWFYGGNQSYADKIAFETAFLKHMHRNPHHWQYWILTHDNSGEPETEIEMPIPYVFEMICDWWSFSWRKGDLYEIFSWWDEHKDYIKLEKHTRELVEKILNGMKKTLDELKEEEPNAD